MTMNHSGPASVLSFPTSVQAGQAVSLEGLFTSQPVETFAAGQPLFWEGDPAKNVFQIVEGCVRLYRILSDGRRAVTGFVFGGEALGISFPDFCLHTAEAVTKVRLRRLSRARFLSAVESSSELRAQLIARLHSEMRAAHHHVVVLGQLTAEERVVSFLLSTSRRTGTDRSRPVLVELPMCRLDIADYLGLTIETVCRVISRLKRDGLIGLQGRHSVILKRPESLWELAGITDEGGEQPMQQSSACASNAGHSPRRNIRFQQVALLAG
jgi:CRP/FNR family transcriptional regulator, anaerobic regulatory protein